MKRMLLERFRQDNAAAEQFNLDDVLTSNNEIEQQTPIFPDTANNIIVFKNGDWHDLSGKRVELSEKAEFKVIDDIKQMELMTFHDCSPVGLSCTAHDIGRRTPYYCKPGQAYVFYKWTSFKESGKTVLSNSPTTSINSLAKNFHMIAVMRNTSERYDCSEFKDHFNIAEVLDLMGSMSMTVSVSLVKDFISWLKDNDIKAFHCDLREDTSFKLMESKYVKGIFKRAGYVNIKDILSEDEYGIPWKFIPNTYVLTSWYSTTEDNVKNWIMYKANGKFGTSNFLLEQNF